jgi:hypothetical protein
MTTVLLTGLDVESFPEGLELRRQSAELFEVLSRELLETAGTEGREGEPNQPLVVGVGDSCEQAGVLGAVDEADDAVASQKQMLGDVSDRGPQLARVAAHGEQKLMLRGREPDTRGLLFAPMQESPQSVAELEELSVVRVTELSHGDRRYPSIGAA